MYSVTTSNLSAAVDFTMASKKTTQNLPEAEDQQQEVGARRGVLKHAAVKLPADSYGG